MQDQASTHGLLGHPALTQPIKNILLEEAKRENLTITLENGPDNTLTINPVTTPLENVSRWLTTAQITYGIVIEDLQFTLAGNEEITLKHLSFRATIMTMLLPLFILVGFIAGYFVNVMAYHLSPLEDKTALTFRQVLVHFWQKICLA